MKKFLKCFSLLIAIFAILPLYSDCDSRLQSSLCGAIKLKEVALAQERIAQLTLDCLGITVCEAGYSLIDWLCYYDGNSNCDNLYLIAKSLIDKGYKLTEDDKKLEQWRPCQKIKDCLLYKKCPPIKKAPSVLQLQQRSTYSSF